MNRQTAPIPGHPLLLSLSAGVLLTLSFPPFDLPVLQIPAFMILLQLSVDSPGWREAALRIFPGLLVWNLTATYWLMMATLPGGAAAIVANSILMLFPLELIRRLHRRQLHPLLLAVLAGAVWSCFEFAHHSWQLAWPWLTLANAWSSLPVLIQYISWTGHLAVSFWVVSSALLALHVLGTLEREQFVHALGFVLIFPALSLLAENAWEEVPSGEFEVAVIQPNLDSYLPLGGLESVDEVLDNLLMLSDSIRTGRTRLIVWPENAIETAIGLRNPYNERISDSLRNWQAELITGSAFIDFYEDRPAPAITRSTTDGRPFNVYNAALHFTPEGLTDVYRKGRLVPIVERLPYAETLQRLDLFGWIDWGSAIGYGRGTLNNNFSLASSATPALICYDSVYPDWVGRFVRNGAGFITIITNDGWWGDTAGHSQHFSYARLRAIEFRQWVVRSANNGISGIITPRGEVIDRTGYWTRTAIAHTIRTTDRMTPFARFGNWFNWLMAAGTLLAFLLLLRPIRPRN